MDVAIEALDKASALLTHIPGVGDVVDAASAIAQKVQEFQDTRDACKELGLRAIAITLKVCDQLTSQKSNKAITENLENFLRVLRSIRDITNRRLGKGFKNTLKLLANTQKINKKITKLDSKLQEAMGLLGIELALDCANALQNLKIFSRSLLDHIVSVKAEVALIKQANEANTQQLALIMTHSYGHFKHIGHDALVLLDTIPDLTTRRPEVDTISRWRAVLIKPSAGPEMGNVVLLHRYKRGDVRFEDAVMIAKTWHPYILTIFGRSPPDQVGEPYIVIDDYLDASYYQTFGEYSSSLSGFDNLRGMLLALHDLCEVAEYLEGEDLHRSIVYDRPTSRWLLNDERDVEQSELYFDLRSRRIKWKLECPRTPGEVIEECHNHTPLFGLPALSGSRKQLIEELEDMLHLPNGPQLVEQWFFFLQAQSSLLGLHRLAATLEPTDLKSLAPVGAWLVQTQTSLGFSRWLQLDLGDFEMHPQQTSWFLPMYEEHRPDEMSPQTDANDACLVTIFRAGVYPSDAYYTTYRHTISGDREVRDETNVDFFLKSDRTTWKRSRFPSLHFGTTLSFPQYVGSNFTMPQVLPSLDDAALSKKIAIVTAATYIVETTLDRSAYVKQEEATPLWFFILEHNNIDNYLLRRDVPWGFWSAEENPTSIPPDITFLPTPSIQVPSAFPLAWNQELGGRVFCIRARVALECMTLTEDEALVLKQCYGTTRHPGPTIAESSIQGHGVEQGEDHFGGATAAPSFDDCGPNQGEEWTLASDEDEMKSKDKFEAGTKGDEELEAMTKGDDKQPEQASLHSTVVISFLATVLFLMIAPSFLVVPCLLIVPIVTAFASHISAESRSTVQ